MVQCFVPDCNHQSESHTCRFFGFPSQKKKKQLYNKWVNFIRRKDREPNAHSRVCSCHFRGGEKSSGPEIFERNKNKLFPSQDKGPPKKKKKSSKKIKNTVQDMVDEYMAKQPTLIVNEEEKTETIHRAEVDTLKRELDKCKVEAEYKSLHYTVSTLGEEVIRMETGLPTKDIFYIVVNYVTRFKASISYYSGWNVELIPLEDQVFITLMKLRQNYTNLHLAQLFSCSVGTISNIVITFINVLHNLFFVNIMTSIPSREKNRLCSPSSFSQYTSCRIVIDCTDIEVATPGLMSTQNITYSSYRGMNSFKVLVGVAPNAVITFVSKLFPGSISDKEITKQSSMLDQMATGDLILADKGFLIQDILPNGVYVNIPPFLQNGKFTESEVKATKSIAKCRIHVERANARLKDFKILSFIPPYLRCHVDIIFQLCAALVNLQFPLIKEGCEGMEFQ